MKLPFYNRAMCEGMYGAKGYVPRHLCWMPHALLGVLSVWYPVIVLFFVAYQVSQMVLKANRRHSIWDDLVDVVEFTAARWTAIEGMRLYDSN